MLNNKMENYLGRNQTISDTITWRYFRLCRINFHQGPLFFTGLINLVWIVNLICFVIIDLIAYDLF